MPISAKDSLSPAGEPMRTPEIRGSSRVSTISVKILANYIVGEFMGILGPDHILGRVSKPFEYDRNAIPGFV